MFSLNNLYRCVLLIIFCYCSATFASSLQNDSFSKLHRNSSYQHKKAENGLLSFLFSSDEKTLYILYGPILNGPDNGILYTINAESKKIIKKIPLGKISAISPRSIVATPDNKKFYISGYQHVLSIDPITGAMKEIKTTSADSFMGAMAITHDGRTLFATEARAPGRDDDLNAKKGLYVIDTKSDQIISYIPKKTPQSYLGFQDMALSLDETKLYLIEAKGKHALSYLDTRSLILNEQIITNEDSYWWPTAIIPANHHNKLYIPIFNFPFVYVVDDISYKIINKIHVGDLPWDGTIAANTNKLYVSNSFRASKSLSVIDTSNNQVIKTIPLESSPYALRASSDGKKVYAAHAKDFSISIIDTTTDKVIDTWHFADDLKQQ